MRNYTAKNVDDYIATAAAEARPKLAEIRAFVKTTVPHADETISWGVPFYKQHGLLAGFSVFKNHVSFGLCAYIPEEIRKTLEKQGYKTGSKTIQIRFDQKLPARVIAQILKNQAKANEATKFKKNL